MHFLELFWFLLHVRRAVWMFLRSRWRWERRDCACERSLRALWSAVGLSSNVGTHVSCVVELALNQGRFLLAFTSMEVINAPHQLFLGPD
ncbi:hypothetical protein EDB19DRAFT_143632 [Suillus lakei]|nr:hypothetical protein EDB19DRAFT_143632 [Suillus lakei]